VTANFERHSDGVRFTLGDAEWKLLLELPAQLHELYHDSEDEAYNRIFPRAYLDPTEENAELQWLEFVHPSLVQQRLDALGLVVSTLEQASGAGRGLKAVDLDEDSVAALLGVLNDARLILGNRLGINEDSEIASTVDPGAQAAYNWLSYLEGDLLETLLG